MTFEGTAQQKTKQRIGFVMHVALDSLRGTLFGLFDTSIVFCLKPTTTPAIVTGMLINNHKQIINEISDKITLPASKHCIISIKIIEKIKNSGSAQLVISVSVIQLTPLKNL